MYYQHMSPTIQLLHFRVMHIVQWQINYRYRISSNTSPGDYKFEDNFVREYFWESNCSSQSVIGMMHYFDITRYSSRWGKNCLHYYSSKYKSPQRNENMLQTN